MQPTVEAHGLHDQLPYRTCLRTDCFDGKCLVLLAQKPITKAQLVLYNVAI